MTTLNRLPRTTPEQAGIPSSAVEAFVDQLARDQFEAHGFMIIRNGCVAAEGWWKPYSPELPHLIFSITKSFTSTAVGLAVQEGLLSVQDRIAAFFPDKLPQQPSERLLKMTVHDLLAMATGHDGDPTEPAILEGGDWLRAFFEAPVPHEPGTHFAYNSGASHVLGLLIERVSGVPLQQFLSVRLLQPLGITVADWKTLPGGQHAGGFGLCITLEDVAKLGLLYEQKGIWNGKRLLDEQWIEASAALQISNGTEPDSDWAAGYGYQLWRCRHGAYRFAGLFAQKCVIIPSHHAVIAVNSADWNEHLLLNAIWNHLLPAMSDQPLPADDASVERLRDRLSTLDIMVGDKEQLEDAVPLERSYHFEPNEAGLTSLSLRRSSDGLTAVLHDSDGEREIRYGIGHWAYAGEGLDCTAARASWLTADELCLVQHEVWTPFKLTITIRTDGCEAELHIVRNLSWALGGWPDLNLKIRATEEQLVE
ncbi:serine hydrolase domain-containing protein [Paenibacillus kobensis]|uniref:serine hydrolase domain-containing protein n=1 Tax=Paenibacillus kobensis TaxID=59841 RepID=UPI000FDA9733|nr:serine hydrolase [Paenibacillus kobensis]